MFKEKIFNIMRSKALIIREAKYKSKNNKLNEEKSIEENMSLENIKKDNKIGERIKFRYGSKGEFALTIDSVHLTNKRNQFADPVKNVVEINYTVENISMNQLDFFIENQARFHDSEGFKCSSYPNIFGIGTYNISKGKKASSKEFIGIEKSELPYLEMILGDTIYKWEL